MDNFNFGDIAELPFILSALNNKKTIADFINDQQMINEVRTQKAFIIAEICNHDPVIRARFNNLLCQF